MQFLTLSAQLRDSATASVTVTEESTESSDRKQAQLLEVQESLGSLIQ